MRVVEASKLASKDANLEIRFDQLWVDSGRQPTAASGIESLSCSELANEMKAEFLVVHLSDSVCIF